MMGAWTKLAWVLSVLSPSISEATFLSGGRGKCLFVAALGLFHKMRFRPDFPKYITGCIRSFQGHHKCRNNYRDSRIL